MYPNFFKYGSDLELLKLYFVQELTTLKENRKQGSVSLAVPWDLNITKKAGEFLYI